MDHMYLRSGVEDGDFVALGSNLFRKQLLRYGVWDHPKAPGGKLTVTKEFVTKIVDNFKKGLRDDVPVPKGHDLDALSSVGKIVGLEQDDSGLWGIHEIIEDVDKIGKTYTGTSAFIDMAYVDKETGKEHGPVLIHNALTNAPYIKGLAPFEAIALGEDANEAVVISLPSENKGRSNMTVEELLAQLDETSDDDLRKALEAKRPELFGSPEGNPEDAEKVIADAKKEAREELVAALAEKGVTVSLSEENEKDGAKAEVDIQSSPEFVALSERVENLESEKKTTEAETLIDSAIHDGKVLPAQREGLLEVALSEGGMDRLAKLIPDAKIVDFSEKGSNKGHETNVELSEEDAEAEVDRLVSAYTPKKDS